MDVFSVVKRSPFVFPLACLAAAAMIFVSEGSYWQSVRTLNELGSMASARIHIQSLSQGVLDAETGQRGYLLTGRAEYLKPYEGALRKINESFTYLEPYYAQKPAANELIRQLRELTRVKLSELRVTIELQDAGRREAATELLLSDIGKEKMEAIGALGAELLALETFNVAGGREEVYRTLMISRVGVAALTAMSLLALFLYLRQSGALIRQQLELKRQVQAERDRLEAEVTHRTAQLTELTHHLQTAREDERNRLARNLHDELGALLTSAKLDAARIRSRLGNTAPEALERLAHLVDTLNSSIALGRRIIEDLRPSTLSNLGLVPTLEILTREFADQSGIEVHCELSPVKLEPTAELVIYRVVQEAITNIAKYAKARNVWVTLSAREGYVDVTVRDDGIGFDAAAKRASAYGLVGMRFRVESEGGTLNVATAPGKGTTILVMLPEASPAEA
jgi:signal transduction histidine kinase